MADVDPLVLQPVQYLEAEGAVVHRGDERDLRADRGEVLRDVAPDAAMYKPDGTDIPSERVITVGGKALAVHKDGSKDDGFSRHRQILLRSGFYALNINTGWRIMGKDGGYLSADASNLLTAAWGNRARKISSFAMDNICSER